MSACRPSMCSIKKKPLPPSNSAKRPHGGAAVAAAVAVADAVAVGAAAAVAVVAAVAAGRGVVAVPANSGALLLPQLAIG